jgi:hypothetical protein
MIAGWEDNAMNNITIARAIRQMNSYMKRNTRKGGRRKTYRPFRSAGLSDLKERTYVHIFSGE